MWILVDLHHILVRGRGWSSWLKELMLTTKDNKDTREIGKLFLLNVAKLLMRTIAF